MGGDATAAMTAAARAFLDALDPRQQETVCSEFDAPDRRDWTYLPGPRPGLALLDMTDEQRDLAMALLDTGLSAAGARTARAVMELDGILREIEQASGQEGYERRHPLHYWVRVLGEPGTQGPWAWKVGGHHLAVHLTIVGDRVTGTPQFFGANPATVPAGHGAVGRRTLPDEEDLGRALVESLPASLRAVAVVDPKAPYDIATRTDPVADPSVIAEGLAYDRMNHDARARLETLVRRYLGRTIPEIADLAWGEIEAAGLERVRFVWAGPTERGPGIGHYYAVAGPTFLLEYDNVQTGANHIHTVWRDLRHDWGLDLLAAHYAETAHPDHPRPDHPNAG